jgi:hypothetical protein
MIRPHRRRIIWISILSAAYTLFYAGAIFLLRGQAWERVYASRGELDLSRLDLSRTGSLSLAGEWAFFPETLGTDERAPILPAHGTVLNVPGSWQERQTPWPGFDRRFGAGTYRLALKLKQDHYYNLQFGAVTTAARIWINGRHHASVGKPGASPQTHQAATRALSVVFLAENDWNEIVVEVSNFDHHHGGLVEAPRLTDPAAFDSIHTLQIVYDCTMAVILVILGIHGMTIGFAWPNERASRYLGAFSLCLALQTIMTGSRILSHLGIPWHTYIRIEYLSYVGALPCFVYFVQHSFPAEGRREIPFFISIIAVLYASAVVFLDTAVFSAFAQPFMLIVVFSGSYAAFVCARAIRSGKRDAVYITLGFLIVFGGICIDLLTIIKSQVDLLIAPATAALFAHLNSLALTDRVAFSLFRSRRAVQKLHRMEKAFHNNRQMLRAARLLGSQERVNPHFLFNALSMVHSLVISDPARAEAALLQLADVYRSITNASNKMQVPLTSEWDLISSYLELQNARFKGQVVFDLALRGDLRMIQVPPLALQQIVENCFKHGFIAGAENGGRIRIRINRFRDGLIMQVLDNGRGVQGPGDGVTMHSIRERMSMLYSTVRLRVKSRPSGGARALLLCAGRLDL